MTVKAQKPIVIFRGDNTAAFDLRTIRILLTGDLDLSHATAKFTLLDFSKTWTEQEVATGELSIVFTAEQTKAFALGPQTGTLRLYDMSTGTPRQLTIVNKIPFFVTNRVCEIDSQSYEADVCVSGGDVIHIEFNVGASAVEGKADKVKNAVAGDLASLAADGNLEDSGIPKTDVLRKSQMDSAPTEGSQNPVTSDGIARAIDFVNSSIATNTAYFLGTFDYTTDLGFPQPASSADVSDAAIATALASLAFSQTPTNNDYVFVQIDYSATTPADEFRRFKFNGTAWAYEYTLNNSSFTADQWAAINSGITSGAVAKLGALPTAQELASALAAKYEKPAGGIPASDLADGEQYHCYDAQVEYIESPDNSTAYIDTGVVFTPQTKVVVDMQFLYLGQGEADAQQMGFVKGSATGDYRTVISSANGKVQIFAANQVVTATPDVRLNRHVFGADYIAKTCWIDDNSENISITPSGTFTEPFYLLARNNDGTPELFCKARVYGAKFYEGGVLVRDFAPVRVGTAGCLYDRVSKQLFYPSGGTLFCGADVATTPMNRKYDKPSSGIPKNDLSSAVQTSLGKADTALPKTDVIAPSGSADDVGMAADAHLTYLAILGAIPYAIRAATVSSGTTPTVTNILDRATNTATLGSSVTAATVTLPAATTGKMRDFYIALTVEGSTAPSLTWIDPATNTDADIAVGEDSLANINTGLNIVLFSEAAGQNRWIVSVKHEEAAS